MSFDVYLVSVVLIGPCVTSGVIVANYSPSSKYFYRRGMENYGALFSAFKNITDLPIHLRSKLASVCLPDIARGRTTGTGQHLTSLTLDPIEYFLFHLLSYAVSDLHPLVSPAGCIDESYASRSLPLGSTHAY
jgi:hypothetical protein